MAGQPLFSNYMGLDPIMQAIGSTPGFGVQGWDRDQAEKGVNALKGFMNPNNQWYAQNFGMGATVPDFLDNVYKKYYGREIDQPGKEFWVTEADKYAKQYDDNPNTNRNMSEVQAFLMTQLLGRSDEFTNKYNAEQQAYGGKVAKPNEPEYWDNYQNNARQQRAALNYLPNVANPASFAPGDPNGNKSKFYPTHLQLGAVDPVIAGGVNLGPTIANAQAAAGLDKDTSGAGSALSDGGMKGLLNYLASSGLGDDTIKKITGLVDDAANLNKGLYYGGNKAATGGMATATPASYEQQQQQLYGADIRMI